jgi:hypothetical protein
MVPPTSPCHMGLQGDPQFRVALGNLFGDVPGFCAPVSQSRRLASRATALPCLFGTTQARKTQITYERKHPPHIERQLPGKRRDQFPEREPRALGCGVSDGREGAVHLGGWMPPRLHAEDQIRASGSIEVQILPRQSVAGPCAHGGKDGGWLTQRQPLWSPEVPRRLAHMGKNTPTSLRSFLPGGSNSAIWLLRC